MRFVTSFVFLAASSCGLQQGKDSPEKSLALRRQFARAMDKIEEGMPAERVVEILGPPDDVRTRNDPGGISSEGTKEIWRYGTSGHLTTATLSEVYVGRDGRVEHVFDKGKPLRDGLFEEEELRRLLTVLNESSSYCQGPFNPGSLIRAVNILLPLGKERALAAIAEYLRVSSDFYPAREGTFLVLRALFDVPENPGYMPRMLVGSPSPPEPEDPSVFPRFPLAIEGDIPFLIVRGYLLVGVPQPPEEHLIHFRKHGKLRERPLAPTYRPLEVLQKLVRDAGDFWILHGGAVEISWYQELGRTFLMEQVLRLLSTVYRVEPGRFGELFPIRSEDEEQRRRILDEVGALQIRWDSATDRYVFLDGSTLPEPERKLYRREYWNPVAQGLEIEIAVERRDTRRVDIELKETWRPETSGVAGDLQLFEEGATGRLIKEIKVGKNRPWERGSSSSGNTIDLDEGKSLRLQLVINGQEERGPVFTPLRASSPTGTSPGRTAACRASDRPRSLPGRVWAALRPRGTGG